MRRRALLWVILGTALICGRCTIGVAAAQEVTARTGAVQGSVVDGTGAAIAGATVAAGPAADSGARTTTDASGAFALRGIAAGRTVLTLAAPGFLTTSRMVVVSADGTVEVGLVTMALAGSGISVEVIATREEVAAAQVKEEETQRVLGVFPNFLVTYRPDAVPLTVKQKFGLTGRLTIDPAGFVIAGVIAGAEQATNDYAGYGQGTQGFGKRYGAAFADFAIGNVLGSAVLPALFRQDPRYFVKGTGTVRARVMYAVANAVVRKGDNGRWQPDYSGILGGLGAAAISNLYYPAGSRNGAGTLFKATAIGIGGTAAGNVLQEFLLRKFTKKGKGGP